MVKHVNHSWKVACPPPLIRPHSACKHRVLRDYLNVYLKTLTSSIYGNDTFTLTLVDGFSGGGLYENPEGGVWDGSPIIMLKTVNDFIQMENQKRKKKLNFDVRYIFVDSNHNSSEYLTDVIKNSVFAKLLFESKICVINKEFEAVLPAILDDVRMRRNGERVIFFLDQFGYNQVSFNDVKRIMCSLKNPEVILTLAIDFFIDYLSNNEQSGKKLAEFNLEEYQDIDSLKRDPNWKLLLQRSVHQNIPLLSKARFHTPFLFRSSESNKDLWLVHLSNTFRAKDKMLEVHWDNGNFQHFGFPGLDMMGYDHRKSDLSGQMCFEGFAFDELASRRTLDALIDELPRRIPSGGVSFGKLFMDETNNSPAKKEIFRQALKSLIGYGEIEIKGVKGENRRTIQADGDLIIPKRPLLYLPLNSSND